MKYVFTGEISNNKAQATALCFLNQSRSKVNGNFCRDISELQTRSSMN